MPAQKPQKGVSSGGGGSMWSGPPPKAVATDTQYASAYQGPAGPPPPPVRRGQDNPNPSALVQDLLPSLVGNLLVGKAPELAYPQP